MKKIIVVLTIVAVACLAIYGIKYYKENAIYHNKAFAYGNGRIEATEVIIATKIAEKIEGIYVDEGELVKKGQHLAQMQTNVLKASLAQANAIVKVREAELVAAKAKVKQNESNVVNAEKRLERAKVLIESRATSQQEYDNISMVYDTAIADLDTAKAKVMQAEASITAAKADAARIQADIDDCRLAAPLDGRIQYHISEVGEVLNAGGRVLNLVDLTDVYLTFFLPEGTAGKVKIGSEVRILLDVLPENPIPAKVTFVASVAQFTPKTVETKVEREKLMFRIKARINPELLEKNIEFVKTGLPGVAWVKIDDNEPWPDFLQLKEFKSDKK